MQKTLAMAPKKMRDSFARTGSLKKEQVTVTTKYEELHSNVEQRVSSANKETAHLEENVKAMQKQDASVTMAEQLSLEVQYVPKLPKEAKKLRYCVSALKNVGRANV